MDGVQEQPCIDDLEKNAVGYLGHRGREGLDPRHSSHKYNPRSFNFRILAAV